MWDIVLCSETMKNEGILGDIIMDMDKNDLSELGFCMGYIFDTNVRLAMY